MDVLAGTREGLFRCTGSAAPAEVGSGAFASLARGDDGTLWAVVDGRSVYAAAGGGWRERVRLPDPAPRCLLPHADGALVGTEGAHLFRLRGDGALERIEAFEAIETRRAWHTPWGGPPATWSLARGGTDAELFVNVHVGGVVRSTDGGASWRQTALPIEADVHQVAWEPSRRRVLVAAAQGYAASDDAGASWRFATEGLHGHYLRGLAVAGEHVLVGASTGPRAERSALYRRPLDGEQPFERCDVGPDDGLPGNTDGPMLVAEGATVALGTREGEVYRSDDGGASWRRLASGLAPVASVILAGGDGCD